jgi:hypothetical protein
MHMNNTRRLLWLFSLSALQVMGVSRASLPLTPPAATAHVCVLFKSGTAEVEDRSLKAAHNFGALVADHLRDGSKSLSLAIWRGTIDRPNSNEANSESDPTPEEHAYVESIFGYEIGRMISRIVYLRSSNLAQCGIEASAFLDVALSGALCGKEFCKIECTEAECKKR